MVVYFYSSDTTKTIPNTTTNNLSNKIVNISIVSNAGKANSSISYDPPSLYVDKNMEVKWNNNDSVIHSVTSGTPFKDKTEKVGQLFDSGAIKPNESFSYVFNTPGTFDYYCVFHPFTMSGQVIVS
jgi:plastocyanin